MRDAVTFVGFMAIMGIVAMFFALGGYFMRVENNPYTGTEKIMAISNPSRNEFILTIVPDDGIKVDLVAWATQGHEIIKEHVVGIPSEDGIYIAYYDQEGQPEGYTGLSSKNPVLVPLQEGVTTQLDYKKDGNQCTEIYNGSTLIYKDCH